MGILYSIGHATLVVQFIIFILLGMSVLSWAVIAWKAKHFISVSSIIEDILNSTSGERDRGVKISDIKSSLGDSQAEKIIFKTVSNVGQKITKCTSIEEIAHIERLVKDSSNSEIYKFKTSMDRFTSSLATIALIAPYVGLLGTVWGLLDAFQNLSDVKVVTFQTVAPSIVEALFATAIGLFVAIPASAGFNVISKQSNKMVGKLTMINDSLINQISQIKCASIQERKKVS
ncbi:MotA/TolQ/ExbB proton channel family protein [Vibrio hepatarius]|uniref:MotA/TolQ/ExbB proton channel family protein n=1 Tax=Vibrio hepatarius TaxID=171383 RepID=UPI001C089FBE|nr:MotA/TolQ/ExbB proton channel family protein [Vibrio hepatarius]MBU2895955.1 MotA/TolQ/ExbB proton channel family protein [Vibrio hepatarius]